MAVTSQIPVRIREEDIYLSPHEQKEAGLPKASIVKTGKIVTIDQRLIQKKIGAMSQTTYKRLIDILVQTISG